MRPHFCSPSPGQAVPELSPSRAGSQCSPATFQAHGHILCTRYQLRRQGRALLSLGSWLSSAKKLVNERLQVGHPVPSLTGAAPP